MAQLYMGSVGGVIFELARLLRFNLLFFFILRLKYLTFILNKALVLLIFLVNIVNG